MNWQIAKVTGSPQEIKEQLSKDAKLPQHVKDFVLADLASTGASPAIVTAYSQDVKGLRGETLRSIQITLKF